MSGVQKSDVDGSFGHKQQHHNHKSSYVLGIDIGTTTIKVSLVDAETRKVIGQSLSRETKASVVSDLGHLGNEQDVHKICTALQFCVSRLPKESLGRIVRIGVSGQMHGIMLWKAGAGWHRNHFGRFETGAVSQLFTWQDGRCTSDFLATLPTPRSHLRLSSGHGCATLFWLTAHRPDLIEKYDRAGTVQDYVVAMLCGNEGTPLMSVQNAASWGYFDTVSATWNTDRLEGSQFPVHLLPRVVQPGHTAGHLLASWYDIREVTPVGVALGDMQCSVISTSESADDAVLNISTSAQLSFIMPQGFVPTVATQEAPDHSPVEYFPYFEGRYLAVAASLNGGNVMAVFVRMLQQWTHELGLGVPEDRIWEKILAVAQEDSSVASDMVIIPTLFGERHLPEQRASVLNIDPVNITLGKVARCLCQGVVRNIHDIMSRELLIAAGIQRIVGSGSALTRNPVLRKEVESHYNLPVVYGAGTDAAVGVALAMITHSKATRQETSINS